MQKFVIGGGPHTGKTTLLEALRQEMPEDTHFIPEPAGILIRSELAKQSADTGYKPILPTTEYPAFVKRAIAKSIELEKGIPHGTPVTMLDRSIVDNVGYANHHGYSSLIPDIQPHIHAAGYTAIFLCRFVGVYDQTCFRMGDEEYAHQVHEHLATAYEDSGLPIIEIPPVGVPERVGLVLKALETIG